MAHQTFRTHSRRRVCYDKPVSNVEPSDETVHRIHDRYLEDIVEGLNLCPFSRRARARGCVQRPLLRPTSTGFTAAQAVHALQACCQRHANVEIVLLTFVDLEGFLVDLTTFESFLTEVRQLDAATRPQQPSFYMVSFHPQSGRDLPRDRALTPDMLVQLIRRTPDPVIQCVHTEVLHRVRQQAQETARQRLLASVRHDPKLYALLERSVQTDSQLSGDIARSNFEAIGHEPQRSHYEALLNAIFAERDRDYGRA